MTAAVVEYLEELDGSSPEEIGESIGTSAADVREELESLEVLGLVYRTTRGRTVRFWLG
jgi:predicted ArsR family transcriptional regulator